MNTATTITLLFNIRITFTKTALGKGNANIIFDHYT